MPVLQKINKLYMEMFKNAITWAEIPVSDFNRAKKFYSTIYDYEMPEVMMGPNRMGFLLFDQANGGIGAAIAQGESYEPSHKGVKVYLNGGNNLSTVLNRIEKAGGKILVPKTQITPELGFVAVFEDTEGNHLSIHSVQ
jgi:predicted enzyme related to lactoylglutathione lyase